MGGFWAQNSLKKGAIFQQIFFKNGWVIHKLAKNSKNGWFSAKFIIKFGMMASFGN